MPDQPLADLQKPYIVMRQALDKVARDIVYSLCQYGMGNVWEWGEQVGGNFWRTTGDLTDVWSNMAAVGFRQAGREKWSKPGHWTDPDMLVIGKVGWGPNIHDTRLTPNEQITHITLWTIQAAPLLIGADMAQFDKFTTDLMTNHEVLEVNQDVLGRGGARVVAGSSPRSVGEAAGRRHEGRGAVQSRPAGGGRHRALVGRRRHRQSAGPRPVAAPRSRQRLGSLHDTRAGARRGAGQDRENQMTSLRKNKCEDHEDLEVREGSPFIVFMFFIGFMLMFLILSPALQAQYPRVPSMIEITDYRRAMVTAPPAELKLDPFYKKYADATGVPIAGSEMVQDDAILMARDIVSTMLSKRADIRAEFIKRGGRVLVIAYEEGQTDLPDTGRCGSRRSTTRG